MTYTITTCPECGGWMNLRSKRCRRCYHAAGTHGHRLDACPKCGQPKDARAKTCRACQDPRLPKHVRLQRVHQAPYRADLISHDWAVQFCGLFMGEGSFAIRPSGNSGNIIICMSLRTDDLAVLEDIQSRLGGTVYQTEAGRMSRWDVTGIDHCQQILELIAYHTLIPARKLPEIRVALDFIAWRRTRPYRNLTADDADKVQEFQALLTDIRTFKEPQGQGIST